MWVRLDRGLSRWRELHSRHLRWRLPAHQRFRFRPRGGVWCRHRFRPARGVWSWHRLRVRGRVGAGGRPGDRQWRVRPFGRGKPGPLTGGSGGVNHEG